MNIPYKNVAPNKVPICVNRLSQAPKWVFPAKCGRKKIGNLSNSIQIEDFEVLWFWRNHWGADTPWKASFLSWRLKWDVILLLTHAVSNEAEFWRKKFKMFDFLADTTMDSASPGSSTKKLFRWYKRKNKARVLLSLVIEVSFLLTQFPHKGIEANNMPEYYFLTVVYVFED